MAEMNPIESAITQIAEEKGIPKEHIIGMIEAALASAFKKDFGEVGQNIETEFDIATGHARVFDVKTVVEMVTEDSEEPEKEVSLEDAQKLKKNSKVGDVIRTEVTPKNDAEYGRIAAQTAKQVIVQKLREAERNIIFQEFKNKEKTLVNGVVQRLDGENVLVDLGKAVGILFPSEQIRTERYRPGERLKVLILNVESIPKGPKIVLSRRHAMVVRRLFELEVPEIFSGVVEIKAIAREAGSRTKIAVISNQDGVDPIGACVGQRGTRVQTVIAELGGEKIDIIEWSADLSQFIINSLSPAKVTKVDINDEEKSAIVTVPDDQLSLAIGRDGQNVRLAARLSEHKLDIITAGGEEKASAEATTEGTQAEGEESDEEEATETPAVAASATETPAVEKPAEEPTESAK